MENVIDGRCYEAGWFDRAFGREDAVVLELGCGHSDYMLAQARSQPDRWFLGVDRNGARLWKGARAALDEGLANVLFLNASVEALDEHVPSGRAAEIWVLFPDPLPKSRQSKHRLVSPGFLACYRRWLSSGGAVRLKTDDPALTAFAEQAVRAVGGRVSARGSRIAEQGGAVAVAQTTYERRYRAEGRSIHERTFWLD
jgi:tRNA (guanine-N7-)-methyltransferase